MAERDPIGDWVQVWGQVAESRHPEDITVRFESHNSDYLADVRLDRVTLAEGTPEFARRCTRLRKDEVWPETLLHCTKHEGHGGKHRCHGVKWTEAETSGYFEEA